MEKCQKQTIFKTSGAEQGMGDVIIMVPQIPWTKMVIRQCANIQKGVEDRLDDETKHN